MALATLSSRVLGLVREQCIAHFFGASGVTDAFLVAFRIPNLLRELFAEGAFSSAFVPTFTEVKAKDGQEKARDLFWSLASVLLVITSIIGMLTYFYADHLIDLFASNNFQEDLEKVRLAVELTKMMSPFLCFISIAALTMGALNTYKVFFVPSFAPATFNFVTILAIFFITPWLISQGYPSIFALGIGTIIGGLTQALVQVPSLIKVGLRPKKPTLIFSQHTVKILKLMGPGMLGLAVGQINVLVGTILATRFIGAVSWLNYAFRLFQFPIGILSVSLGSSNLVYFSDAWKNSDKKKALNILETTLGHSLFLMIPILVCTIVLRQDLVSIIFQRGQFDSYDTVMTAKALLCYAFGLPFYGMYKVLVPTFYVLGKPKIPVWSSVFSVCFNIVLCVTFIDQYGHALLALGSSISMFINCIILSYNLKRLLDLSWSYFFNLGSLKILISGCVTYLCMNMVHKMLIPSGIIDSVVYLLIDVASALTVYLVALFMLGERKMIRRK